MLSCSMECHHAWNSAITSCLLSCALPLCPCPLNILRTHLRPGGSHGVPCLQESARGLQAWRAALDRGLLPDEMALQQIVASGEESFTEGRTAEELKWPEEPLNTMMVRLFSKLGAARFARKYPAVKVSCWQPCAPLAGAHMRWAPVTECVDYARAPLCCRTRCSRACWRRP
jgi:hypothetical protein